LATFMKGTPVSPRSDPRVSAAPTADDPPNAYSTSDQEIRPSSMARRAATTPYSRPVLGWRPRACIPIPTMATSDIGSLLSGGPCGAEGERETASPDPVSNGTMASSVGMPSAQVGRLGIDDARLDLDLAGQLHVAGREWHELLWSGVWR
jgi:hypothetical protein